MKKIYILFSLIVLMSACKKEVSVIHDLRVSPEEITRIELRADHKTLIPNGVSEMEFHTFAYATRLVDSYNRDAQGVFYTKKIEQEFLVPKDQLPDGFIKVYHENGEELKDKIYSTTSDTPGKVLNFYAKAGNLQSTPLPITIRALPDESYEEIVVPVIFHMLIPPPAAGPSYEISSEFLEAQLQRISDVFNRKVTKDPNAGNVKITFKLALYDNNGNRMQEPGKQIENISTANMTAMGTSSNKLAGYKNYILQNKNRLIWNPNRYLNIWLTKFTTGTSAYGTSSYAYLLPTVMHTDFTLTSIPGLTNMKHQNTFNVSDITDCLQAGIMVNYMSFFNPNTQGANQFSLSTVVAHYYGLLSTYSTYAALVNGDNDYCPDTYPANDVTYPSVFKGSDLRGQPAGGPIEYFTSFNVIDVYSRKSSVSADQASRMRKVLKQCPSRWAYKSNWALSGKD